MMLENDKKPACVGGEKILSLFTVIFLFLIVGSLLFYISLQNKEKNDELKNKVLRQKIEKENLLKLNALYMASSTLPEITSKSFLTLAITNEGTKKILNQKNPTLVLPIASVTKLMVGVIILENIDLNTEVTATLDYIGQEESAFILETNKRYKVKELLANALISSDNDSARLLSSTMGEKNFVDKMNLKAKEIGLINTNYINVTGLDPTGSSSELNVSTVTDLANLLIYIKNNHPEIFSITAKTAYDFCDIENYCKNVINTNKLLENKDMEFNIIGGKTGSTDLAGKNLALMTKILPGLYLINIVLGSENNFIDTMSLINNIKIIN